MNEWRVARRIVVLVLVLVSAVGASGPIQHTNPTAAVLSRFEDRAKDYIKVRNQAEATLPPLKSTKDPELIKNHQKAWPKRSRRLG